VWLDAARAHQLLAPLGADLQPTATPQTAPVACAVCGHGMHICLTRLAGVEIDVCGPHGVWFDRHELERVSQAVARITGQPLPQAPQSWVNAQPPAAPAAAPHGVSFGPGVVVGAAGAGLVTAGAAAVLGGGMEAGLEPRSSFGAVDALSVAPDVASTGFAVADAAAPAAEVAGDVAEGAAALAGGAVEAVGDVAGGAAEAAGSILSGIFDAIGSIFS
jgi:Zn-finger nucleic acid-binding protein